MRLFEQSNATNSAEIIAHISYPHIIAIFGVCGLCLFGMLYALRRLERQERLDAARLLEATRNRSMTVRLDINFDCESQGYASTTVTMNN